MLRENYAQPMRRRPRRAVHIERFVFPRAFKSSRPMSPLHYQKVLGCRRRAPYASTMMTRDCSQRVGYHERVGIQPGVQRFFGQWPEGRGSIAAGDALWA